MGAIVNERRTLEIYLHVPSCLEIPSLYCDKKSLKLTFKMVLYRKEQRAKKC